MNSDGKKQKVFLLGEDEGYLCAVKDLLSQNGCVPDEIEVARFDIAVKTCSDLSADLVIADIRGAGPAHRDVLNGVKDRFERAGFIAVCDDHPDSIFKDAVSELFDDVIPDPLENAECLKKAVLCAFERNRLRDSLREAREDLELILKMMPSGLFMVDRNMKITLWSSKAEELTGYSSDEIVGSGCEVLHVLGPGGGCAFDLSDGSAPSSGMINIRKKNGEEIAVLKNVAYMYDECGDVRAGICSFSDITELKQREESYAQMAYLVESSDDAIISVSLQGEIKTWNEGAERLYGYTESEAKGNVIPMLLPPSQSEEVMELLEKVSRGDSVEQFETEHTRKDGTPVFVSLKVSPIRDRGGKVFGISFNARDITNRKHAQDELRKLNRAVEQSASVVVITDAEGRIEYVNPKFTEVTGYRIGEVLGKNPNILKSRELPDDIYKNLWSTISSGLEWRGEFCNLKKNGDSYWEMASISPIKDDDGIVTHYIKVAEDITEQKDSEKRMLRLATFPELSPLPIVETNLEGEVTYINPVARLKFPVLMRSKGGPVLEGVRRICEEMIEGGRKYTVRTIEYDGRMYRQDISYVRVAERVRIYMTDITEREMADRMKDEIISTVSHELRTPLSITKEGISLILEGIVGEVSEKQTKILTTAKHNINRLGRIINELLDVSKFESGKVVMRRQMTDLITLAETVVGSFRPTIERAKEIDFETEYSKSGIMLYVDPDKIAQVFTNLLANAFRFTEKGSVKLSIKNKGDKVECRVSDTGKGLKKSELPRVFDKFQQFGRVAGMGDKGTGLGLSITKSILDLHKGSIAVDSQYGHGTEVTFTLPVYDPMGLAHEFTEKAIERSREEGTQMSVIFFTAEHEGISQENTDFVYQELSDIIHRQLHKVEDFVLRDDNWCLVGLFDCNDIEVIKAAGRFHKRMGEYLEERHLSDKMKIKNGLATYPYDGTGAREIIKKAGGVL